MLADHAERAERDFRVDLEQLAHQLEGWLDALDAEGEHLDHGVVFLIWLDGDLEHRRAVLQVEVAVFGVIKMFVDQLVEIRLHLPVDFFLAGGVERFLALRRSHAPIVKQRRGTCARLRDDILARALSTDEPAVTCIRRATLLPHDDAARNRISDSFRDRSRHHVSVYGVRAARVRYVEEVAGDPFSARLRRTRNRRVEADADRSRGGDSRQSGSRPGHRRLSAGAARFALARRSRGCGNGCAGAEHYGVSWRSIAPLSHRPVDGRLRNVASRARASRYVRRAGRRLRRA